MKAKMEIPEEQKPALALVMTFKKNKRETLLRALKQTKPRLSRYDFASEVAQKTKIKESEAFGIINLFAGLYNTMDRYSILKKDFIDQICDTAEATKDVKLKPSDGNWGEFKIFLNRVLSLDKTLGMTSKAQEIMLEYDHVFCKARVLTDLRPVFGSNVEEGPIAGIIVHSLRLSIHEGGDEDTIDIHLALDRNDIKKLQELLVRAKRKEKSLKSKAKKGGINVLEI